MKPVSRLSEADYAELRARMVEEQIRKRGIDAPAVLTAMNAVPRHLFVPEDEAQDAYADHPLSIGYEQTISQPYMVGSMTQELGVTPDSRILEIGTGCGYQAAILATLVKRIFTVECIPQLSETARDRLARLGYENITCRLGDGNLGWPEEAPFDGILVAAAAQTIPPPLIDQLSEGGRLLIPLEIEPRHQELIKVTKLGSQISRETLYGVRFVPLRTDPNC